MNKFLLILILFALVMISNASAGDLIKSENQQTRTHLLDELLNTQSNSKVENGFDYRSLRKTNLSCGIPPIPPIGCAVGSCVCDQNGNNCKWQFICR